MSLEEKSRWNRMANHYQKILNEQDEGYSDRLIDFLRECGALIPGCRVADIGCGVGKYAMRFAQLGCSLLLLDIADNMMEYTKRNLAEYSVPVETAICDWSETDLTEFGWKKSVDLAFAAMTPAIRTKADLKKLCAISNKYCFISKFIHVDNMLYRRVAETCGLPIPSSVPTSDDQLDILRWLLEEGYMPQVRFVHYGWENTFLPEQAEGRVMDSDMGPLILQQGLQTQIRQSLSSLTGPDGFVRETVKAKVIWLLWDVTDR